MESYDEVMARGAAEYSDLLQALSAAGLSGEFVQTGGMNAAIEVQLEAGYSVLLTDAEGPLSWSRTEQHGSGVGLYREADDSEALTYATSVGGGVEAAMLLVETVLWSGRPA